MSALRIPRLTAAEYLAIERAAKFKSEFFNGEMFAMAGASRLHNRVNSNLEIEIGSRIKGGRCQSFSRDLRVLVDRTGLYTYPDLIVACGELEFSENDPDTLVNPTILIEVLSTSTEKYDRGLKFRHYQQIPSLKEYLLVAQDEALVERFVRLDDGQWGLISFVGLEAELAFAAIPVRIPLADVYAGVEFPEPSGSTPS